MTTIPYATLAQAREEVREYDPAIKSGDEYIQRSLIHVSARIDGQKNMTYAPLKTTRYLDGAGDHIDDLRGELVLDYPLLELASVVVNGVTWAADIDYLPQPRGRTPYSGVRIPASSGKRWGNGADWIEAVALTGTWGFRQDYAAAFVDSLDTVKDDPVLAAAAGAITVSAFTDSTLDGLGRKPRWSAGQLLRLVSASGTEFMLVLKTETPTLSVLRGVRGTPPLEHPKDTKIEIWTPEPVVERACLRWVSYLYKRRAQFENVRFDGVSTTSFPKDAPEEVRNILDELPDFYTWTAV